MLHETSFQVINIYYISGQNWALVPATLATQGAV